jgi:uncharacterized protein (TIGR03435 family)
MVTGTDSVLASGTVSLVALIADAYRGLTDGIDFPQWVKDVGRVAISVKVPPNTTAGTCREMLRNLLAERFNLVTVIATREVAHYSAKVAKSGFKLKPVEGPPADLRASVTPKAKDGIIHYTYRAAPIARILDAISVQAILEAQVSGLVNDPAYRISTNSFVDETGLTGYYDGGLDLPEKRPQPGEFTEALQDTLQSQLGLTLEFVRAPGKVLVIRSGDRVPTEN